MEHRTMNVAAMSVEISFYMMRIFTKVKKHCALGFIRYERG